MGCATFKVRVVIDEGKSVTLNLAQFRAIILTARREYLPHGVAVVWPPDTEINVVQPDTKERTCGARYMGDFVTGRGGLASRSNSPL